jgi:hypothetical protein
MFGDYHLVSKFYKEHTQISAKAQPVEYEALRKVQKVSKSSSFATKNSKSQSNNSGGLEKKTKRVANENKFQIQNFRTKKILDTKFAEKIKFIYQNFGEWANEPNISEELIGEILVAMQLMKPDETHEKVILAQCNFIESVASLANLLRVADKFRIVLQLLYFLEMRTTFNEEEFFNDIINDAIEFDEIEEDDIREDIQKIRTSICKITSRKFNDEI